MSWVKLDDQFTDHPKVVKAGPMAAWLFVCGLAYCGRFLTDGTIPKEQVRRLADIDDPMTHAAKLVSVGLWHETSDGFQVNDYLEYNPAGDKVRAERSAAKERMSRHRSEELPANKRRSSSSPSPSPSLSLSDPKECVKKHTPEPEEVCERVTPAGFTTFWTAYPNKQGKEEAWRAWQRLKPDAALLETMLSAITQAKAADQWQRGIVPHPSNWLNQKRWTDELPPPGSALARASSAPPRPSTVHDTMIDTARAVAAGKQQLCELLQDTHSKGILL